MSQTSLLKLSSHRAAGKPERLLRSAVTAFSAIARPTRRETGQLDDLAVPLLGSVSDETLRFAAATLSDSPYAPPTLVRRLCDMSVDICAPLLMRSPVLTPIDLLALIAFETEMQSRERGYSSRGADEVDRMRADHLAQFLAAAELAQMV